MEKFKFDEHINSFRMKKLLNEKRYEILNNVSNTKASRGMIFNWNLHQPLAREKLNTSTIYIRVTSLFLNIT